MRFFNQSMSQLEGTVLGKIRQLPLQTNNPTFEADVLTIIRGLDMSSASTIFLVNTSWALYTEGDQYLTDNNGTLVFREGLYREDGCDDRNWNDAQMSASEEMLVLIRIELAKRCSQQAAASATAMQ